MGKPSSLPEQSVSTGALRRKSFFAFALFFILIAAAWAMFRWINRQPQEAGALKPLRRTLEFNEKVFSTVFDSTQLVKEYPVSKAVKVVQVNGKDGLSDSVNEETWRLKVIRNAGDT